MYRFRTTQHYQLHRARLRGFTPIWKVMGFRNRLRKSKRVSPWFNRIGRIAKQDQ